MASIIRRAGRTTADGVCTTTNVSDRTAQQEPTYWDEWGRLALPHHLEDDVNVAAEMADEAPGGELEFRERLWAIHDAYEESELEAVAQRDQWFERETEAMVQGGRRVRAA